MSTCRIVQSASSTADGSSLTCRGVPVRWLMSCQIARPSPDGFRPTGQQVQLGRQIAQRAVCRREFLQLGQLAVRSGRRRPAATGDQPGDARRCRPRPRPGRPT